VPLDERDAQRLGDLEGQHGLAGAGLALDEQRALQGDGGIDGDLEIVGRHVVFRTLELHEVALPCEAGKKTRDITGANVPSQACCWNSN
jgi:hypothetical protein